MRISVISTGYVGIVSVPASRRRGTTASASMSMRRRSIASTRACLRFMRTASTH